MKMIISDYDNTFYINDDDIKININKIRKFRNLNNLFAIATGRSYLDFEKKKDLYNIEYDYVILNRGATILDYNDNVIYNESIDNNIVKELQNDLELNNAVKEFCCSELLSRVDFEYNDLTKIHITYNDETIAKNINDKLNQKYSGYINSYLVGENAIEIISNKTDKAKAIKYLAYNLNINKNNIYTIGDGYSDIEMIRNFNGYCMKNSITELKTIAHKEFDSVSNLIKEVMGGNNE